MESGNEFRAVLQDFIQKMVTACRKATMYSLEHVLVRESVEDLYQVLKSLLEERASLTLAVIEGKIFAEDQQLDKEMFSVRLAQDLASRGMEGVTFFPGVSLRELEIFLSALAARPATLAKQGGYPKLLEEKGVSFIQINQVKYVRLEGKDLGEEEYLSELLSKTEPMPADQRKRLMGEINTNPQRVMKLIEKLAFLETRNGKGNPIKTINMQFLATAFGGLDSELFKGGEPECRAFKKRVANILMVNHPIFRESLLKAFEEVPDSAEGLADRLTPEQRHRTIAKIIASEMGQGKRTTKEIIELLNWLVPEKEEISEILSCLENELQEAGIDGRQRSKLLREAAWDHLPLEQRTELFLREYLGLEQGPLKARGLMVSWLARGNSEPAERIFHCCLEGLSQLEDEGRRATARQCLDMALLFEDKSLVKAACAAAGRGILRQIESEEKPEVRAALANSLGEIINFNIKNDHLDLALSTLTGLKEKAARAPEPADPVGGVLREATKQISSPAVIERLVSLIQDKQYRHQWASISQILKASAEQSVSPVMNALLVRPPDETRERLLDVLAAMGDIAIAEAVRRLNDNQRAVVRSAVLILGYIGSQMDADKLAPAIRHEDATIRKEVVRSLARIGSDKAARLLAQLLKDKDDEVRGTTLLVLGNIDQGDALLAILEFATRRGAMSPGDVPLRKRAIEILANRRWKEAVPALVELLEGKSLVSYREPSEIRVQAAAALGAIGGEAALASLRKLSKGFWLFDQQVQEAAQAALRRLEKEEKDAP